VSCNINELWWTPTEPEPRVQNIFPYSRKITNPTTSALTKVVAATIDTEVAAAKDAGESVGGAPAPGGSTGEGIGANEKDGAKVGDAVAGEIGETLAVGAKVPFMAEGAILGPIAGGSNSPAIRCPMPFEKG